MRTIIITGVSKGLGQALSKVLENEQTKLVGFGRTQGEFSGTFHTCDFTKPQLAASIFQKALADEPLEDSESIVFIANAGRLGLLQPAQNLDPFEIEETIAANLTQSALAASAFLKRVESLPVPKAFLQISSGAALPDRAKASWSLYCATKAGQEQLVRTIAKEQENAPHPTVFANINPGVMETAMQEQIRKTSPSHFPEVERFIKLKEEGRIPTPDTIAQKIADLIEKPESLENGKTYNLSM
ncbi:SDR family NAD(P)-dependent oxidoreductase [Pelagicoccus sp. NFK12]|uniref:SDR family NAD(P)-dependent oxidoreductase n=1 Tax=Pelagicoccus enzymogenes TaxID=2773457 RepID=A0A927F6Y7_9BACT|nr:SDR family NAD(P)-dependent oxidoreductase [Pelagicoccus enzymogenes]MBD5779573.1 SDR family NAD(P)-dependent oxidoreductase [Pelagicoccus enzymogenes]MDQ8200365.1 SDR family NAD(P)-dependent oxidoreductase [Pelagicoccus enzymogenes]